MKKGPEKPGLFYWRNAVWRTAIIYYAGIICDAK